MEPDGEFATLLILAVGMLVRPAIISTLVEPEIQISVTFISKIPEYGSNAEGEPPAVRFGTVKYLLP